MAKRGERKGTMPRATTRAVVRPKRQAVQPSVEAKWPAVAGQPLSMAFPKRGAPVPASACSLFQSLGVVHRVAHYRRSAVIFAQGADCTKVMYLQQGSVKLSVLSPDGKEAIVSVLQPGDFFGEACLAGQQATSPRQWR